MEHQTPHFALFPWQVSLLQQGLVWMTWGDCVSCDSALWRGGGPTTPGRASNTHPAGWRFTCTVLCSFWMRCCTQCLWQIQGLLIEDQDRGHLDSVNVHNQTIYTQIKWLKKTYINKHNLCGGGKYKWPVTDHDCKNQCTPHIGPFYTSH